MALRSLRPAVLAAVLLFAGPLAAEDIKAGSLTIERPWSRPTAGANGVAYATLRNAGSEPERLVGVRTSVARVAELHSSTVTPEGVAQMRPLETVEIPAGGEARLAPGGLHIMLVGLTRPLAAGESFPLTLVLEHAGEIEVQVAVENSRAGGATGHTGHHVH